MSDPTSKNSIFIYNARGINLGDCKNSLAVKINSHEPSLSSSVDVVHKSITWNKEITLLSTESKVFITINYHNEQDEKAIATTQIHLVPSNTEIVKWYPLREGGEILIGSKIQSLYSPNKPKAPPGYPPHNVPMGIPQNVPMGMPQSMNMGMPQSMNMGMPQSMNMGMPQNIPMGMPPNMPMGVPIGSPYAPPMSHYAPHRSAQLDIEKILPQNVVSQLTAYDVKEIHKEAKPFAKGSYGVIFKGMVKGIDKPVVIKEMEIRDAKSLEDWKKEISLMVIYRSPFIVELYGYNFNTGTLSIIMEYMSKGDLYNMIHTNPQKHSLSRIMRFRMARHIALGIAHLHKYGIMHRDIKSMNVLVSEDYSCKLADFGTAKIVTSTVQYITYTMNAGTPLWMAPEVKLGGNYNLPADIYSLGLVFYELFEKKLPLWDGTRQIAQLPPSYMSSFIVAPLINVNPQLRLTANQVVDMLDTLIFTIVSNLKKFLSSEHYELKEEFKSTEEKETAESRQLYKYLIGLPKDEIDALMIKEAALPNSYMKVLNNRLEGSKSQSSPGNIPLGQPASHPHYPHGYPPGYSPNYHMGQMGQISQAYPPGYPPGY